MSQPAPGAPGLTPAGPSASATEAVQIVLPGDANSLGTVFGGRVMHWVDQVAAIAAQRHCRSNVVTAAIDALQFKAPVQVGEYAVLHAIVNRAWTTSMEVEVTVDAEHPLTGERRRSSEAFLTFVAIDATGHPTAVRPVAPATPEEWRRYEAADARRAARLAIRRLGADRT